MNEYALRRKNLFTEPTDAPVWVTEKTTKANSRREAVEAWFPNGQQIPGHYRIRKV